LNGKILTILVYNSKSSIDLLLSNKIIQGCKKSQIHCIFTSWIWKTLKGKIDVIGKVRCCYADRSIGTSWLLPNDRLFSGMVVIWR